MLQAVIFDFDGVIVDTEPLHYAAFESMLPELGGTLTPELYEEKYIGCDDRDFFTLYCAAQGRELSAEELCGLIDKKAGIFLDLLAESGAKPLPGAVELIRSLSGTLPLALCSGAVHSDIDPILKELELEDAFDIQITAEDVARSKPDPESYTRALRLLNESYDGDLTAVNCLAIEDTKAGVASAQGAGLRVLGVGSDAEAIKKADLQIESLQGFGVAELKSALMACNLRAESYTSTSL